MLDELVSTNVLCFGRVMGFLLRCKLGRSASLKMAVEDLDKRLLAAVNQISDPDDAVSSPALQVK